MARAESKVIMGYLPIEQKHHAAILSLIQPANTAEVEEKETVAG
jgi:hypothetical protein